VPLALNAEGKRLAKRDGAVTLAELGIKQALSLIADSLGFAATTVDGMLAEFDPVRLPREPWTYQPT
jgi:glutamyl-tRNA synthetase